MRNGWLSFLKMMLQGAGCFWIPDIILHAIVNKNFGGVHAILITIILPILCLWFLFFYCRRKDTVTAPAWLAFEMVLGIWVLCPLAIMISANFVGGTFFNEPLPGTLFDQIIFLIGMAPIAMSAYDGTLFALLIVIIVLPIFGAFLSIKKLRARTANSI